MIQKSTAFLQLIRFPNLLIVVLTQYLVYYFVFVNNLRQVGLETQLNWLEMTGLVIATLCIAAGGYVINDILDREIDRINKPEKMIVERVFSVSTAMWMYTGSIVIGAVLSTYLAIKTSNLPLLSLYPIAVLLLYLYSKYFKKSFLIGNWIVGFFCAFVAGIVWVGERGSLGEYYTTQISLLQPVPPWGYLHQLMLFYIGFAFFSTTYREIIKDLEDVEGDRLGNCQTLPIVWGIEKGKQIAIASGLILLSIVVLFILKVLFFWDRQIILIITLMLPILYSLFLTYKAKTKADFHKISQFIKILMLLGLVMLIWLA
ncbi:MAG: geranylgeranylglycerol-phosphate geranylgeranyltransferase [Bacteroidota bacterium]